MPPAALSIGRHRRQVEEGEIEGASDGAASRCFETKTPLLQAWRAPSMTGVASFRRLVGQPVRAQMPADILEGADYLSRHVEVGAAVLASAGP
jgi:hypothetical protein